MPSIRELMIRPVIMLLATIVTNTKTRIKTRRATPIICSNRRKTTMKELIISPTEKLITKSLINWFTI